MGNVKVSSTTVSASANPAATSALLQPVAEADVARGRLVEQRRAVGSGLLDGDHRGQGLVLHRHRPKRVFRRILVVRRHRGHRLAREQRAVQRHDGMILDLAAEVRVSVAIVFAGEDGADPGDPLRRAGVDGDDARVSVGAPQDPCRRACRGGSCPKRTPPAL